MEYGDTKEDKWYLYKGVKPPERQSHGISEDEIENHINKINDHVHIWTQQGNYIKCNVGQNEHGKNIGVNHILVDSVDGKPVFKEHDSSKVSARPTFRGQECMPYLTERKE